MKYKQSPSFCAVRTHPQPCRRGCTPGHRRAGQRCEKEQDTHSAAMKYKELPQLAVVYTQLQGHHALLVRQPHAWHHLEQCKYRPSRSFPELVSQPPITATFANGNASPANCATTHGASRPPCAAACDRASLHCWHVCRVSACDTARNALEGRGPCDRSSAAACGLRRAHTAPRRAAQLVIILAASDRSSTAVHGLPRAHRTPALSSRTSCP